ncbi:hypothetical protein GWN42_20465 [candidate division KSB1 bacterium]|nr:hypothetical protein [candidate division KSB1 bacterium]
MELEVTTDGSISPANAVGYAAQVLRDHIHTVHAV